MRWLAFLLITGFLAGCKNNLPPAAYHPSVLFEKEIKFISRLNLTKILGDTLQLSNGQTTKRYAISYNPKTKINEVIELGSGKHISGTAGKYKNLYFINQATDSAFAIYALSIEEQMVKGFVELTEQQKRLEQHYSSGKLKDLLLREKGKTHVLECDKKALLPIYSGILVDLPAWEIKP